MKDLAQLIPILSEQCRRAEGNGDLVRLGTEYLADVLTILDADPGSDSRIGSDIDEAWRICSILNSAADNHQLFVDGGGVRAGFRCLALCYDHEILLSVLLALHEVSFTHGSSLVSVQYLARLLRLLGSEIHATSYLSCLILACLLHKGHLDHGMDQHTKHEIVMTMHETIRRWPPDSPPVVHMQHFNIQSEYLAGKQYPVLAYLASWQLNHYTTNDAGLYGYMVFRDLDIAILNAIIRNKDTADEVKQLLEEVLCRCQSNDELADYINMKTFLGSVIAEADVYFENQDKHGLLHIAQRHMPSVLRYLSLLKPADQKTPLKPHPPSNSTIGTNIDGRCRGGMTSDSPSSVLSGHGKSLSRSFVSTAASQYEHSVASDTDQQHSERNLTFDIINASKESDCSGRVSSPMTNQLDNGNKAEIDHLGNDNTRDVLYDVDTPEANHSVNVDKSDHIRGSSKEGGVSDEEILLTEPLLMATPTLDTTLEDLVEKAWKICYIITWGCSYNQTFIDEGGIVIAQQYMRERHRTEAMMTYLLGTLYNISYTHSECLLTSDVIDDLTEQLDSQIQNVSFFSCQILANVVNKHHRQWYGGEPSVETLMTNMMNAIDTWQIDADCDAYNEDMLLADKDKYLAADHLPALQYFISWQFWYNVHHDPTVYSVRIINDDDLTKMKLLVNSEKTDERIKVKLANVIEFCSRREKIKDNLRSILNAVEASWKASDKMELTALCQKHLTTLLAVLDRDSTASEESLVTIVWQTFYYLNWAGGSHKYFVDGGCLGVAFTTLHKWNHLEHVAENILLTLYFVARTHAKYFTRKDFLDHLRETLESRAQRISYISCQLLARIIRKTSPTWPPGYPTEEITECMERAIDRWSLDSDLPINMDVRHVCYLLDVSRPVFQYLMAWVLYSCVQKDASKNCTLIVRHVGINLLNNVIDDSKTEEKVRVLLRQVVHSCGDREELRTYIKMQNYIQSVNEDDQTTDDCIYMKVVLEFLADSATTSTPSQLVEHGWSICYDLIRSGHQEQFLTGNGVKMALDEFRNEDDRAVLRKSVADVLYHVADMRSEHVINPDHLDLLLEALTSPIQTVSYLSSKILCRLLYRGPRHWCLEAPTKDDVILRLRGAIKEWSLDYDMKIKIDDFTTQREYLLSYQQMLQEMAVWELGYQTRRDSNVYKALIRDVGLMLLKELKDNSNFDDGMKTTINDMIHYCDSKEDLRMYAQAKDSLRTILIKIERWSDRSDRTILSQLGEHYMSDVLATLATSQIIALPADVNDDGWTLCEILTRLRYVNDQLFVNSGGLLIAFKCLQQMSSSSLIVRKIIRVLHRAALKNAFAFVRVIHLDKLVELLQSDVQEISFLTCRLLARILYKGSRDWDVVRPTRDDIALQMYETIDGWSMTSDIGLDDLDRFDIDEEMIHLSSGTDQPVLQYFTAWQLCYMMCWKPDKYYRLIIEDIRLDTLQAVIDNIGTDDKVKILLQYVIDSSQRTESYVDHGGHRVEITFK